MSQNKPINIQTFLFGQLITLKKFTIVILLPKTRE